MGRPKGSKSKERMRWVSKDSKSTMVPQSKLQEYLDNGYENKHVTDTQKASKKKWYNNGTQNLIIKEGEIIPDGYTQGQLRNCKYSDFEYVWYTDGVSQKRISSKLGQKIPEGWYKGYSELYKQKMREVITAKGNFHLDNKEYSDFYKEIYNDIDKLTKFVENNTHLTLNEMANVFNCSVGSVYALLNTYKLQEKFDWYRKPGSVFNGKSNAALKLVEFVKSIYHGEIILNTRTIIRPNELDMYIPALKLAIEYNGIYWHSAERGTTIDYYLKKSLACRQLGIRLIHIYEFEDIDIQLECLKQLILYNNDIYNPNDFNKNNLIKVVPKQPELIYNDCNFMIYGAGCIYIER